MQDQQKQQDQIAIEGVEASSSLPATVEETTSIPSLVRGYKEIELTPELARKYLCKGGTDEEIFWFLGTCRALDLDPLTTEVYFVKYGNEPGRTVVGYPKYLSTAYANGLIDFTYSFDNDADPQCVTVSLNIEGRDRPFVWETWLEEVIGLKKDGTPSKFWVKMLKSQLRKCGIVAAIRYSGLMKKPLPYIAEEPAGEGEHVALQPALMPAQESAPQIADVQPLPEHIDLNELRSTYFGEVMDVFASDDDRHAWQLEHTDKASVKDWGAAEYAKAFKVIFQMPRRKKSVKEEEVQEEDKKEEAEAEELLRKKVESDKKKVEDLLAKKRIAEDEGKVAEKPEETDKPSDQDAKQGVSDAEALATKLKAEREAANEAKAKAQAEADRKAEEQRKAALKAETEENDRVDKQYAKERAEVGGVTPKSSGPEKEDDAGTEGAAADEAIKEMQDVQKLKRSYMDQIKGVFRRPETVKAWQKLVTGEAELTEWTREQLERALAAIPAILAAKGKYVDSSDLATHDALMSEYKDQLPGVFGSGHDQSAFQMAVTGYNFMQDFGIYELQAALMMVAAVKAMRATDGAGEGEPQDIITQVEYNKMKALASQIPRFKGGMGTGEFRFLVFETIGHKSGRLSTMSADEGAKVIAALETIMASAQDDFL